jgi:glycosyltransferase involved in cell wall biosynthesis
MIAELPAVSVLMSVHNTEKYLREAVDSILNQTFRNFEFIIIDDGSTDHSKEILEKYATKDSRVHLISRENRGRTKSLNECLALARGELIAIMDADDISQPGRLETQITFLKEHPSCGCVGSSVIYIDRRGQKLFVRHMPENHAEICQAHLMGYGGMIVHPSAMLRRSALDFVAGYDESFTYASDYDLWCRIAVKYELANLQIPLLLYRYHSAAITQAKANMQTDFANRVLRCELERAGRASPVPLKGNLVIHPNDPRWVSAMARRDGFYYSAVIYGAKRLDIAVKECIKSVENLLFNFILLSTGWLLRRNSLTAHSKKHSGLKITSR